MYTFSKVFNPLFVEVGVGLKVYWVNNKF